MPFGALDTPESVAREQVAELIRLAIRRARAERDLATADALIEILDDMDQGRL